MELLTALAAKLGRYFTMAGSMASVYSFAFALGVAVLFLFLSRRRRSPRLLKAIVTKLFTPRIWLARSTRLDVFLLLFNVLVFPAMFLFAVVSYEWIAGGVYDGLVGRLGVPPSPALPGWLASVVITVTLFVAYELAYWVDHFLSHKIPFLWEFHRVHHSATVLTPLTNWRMHPIDTVIFFNLVAIATGSTQAVMHYALGVTAAPYVVQGENLIFLAYIWLYGHLQHSHVWMRFGRVTSRIFMSPAAHQIHHSTNPVHFDKNFGGAFAFWDWMFGTLHVPGGRREVHGVGLADDRFGDNLFLTLIHPFHEAVGRVGNLLNRPNRAIPTHPRTEPAPRTAGPRTPEPPRIS